MAGSQRTIPMWSSSRNRCPHVSMLRKPGASSMLLIGMRIRSLSWNHVNSTSTKVDYLVDPAKPVSIVAAVPRTARRTQVGVSLSTY